MCLAETGVQMSCGCISLAWKMPQGNTPSAVLEMPDLQFRWSCRSNRLVSVDACLADTIRLLWDCNVLTLGCCCGHGKRWPSIVIHEKDDPARVFRILDAVDPRPWYLLQWHGDRRWKITREGIA